MAPEREEIGRISPEAILQCDLSSLKTLLSEVNFPVTKDELLVLVGDEQVPCSGGDQHTLRELLGPLTKEQYNSLEDIQDALTHPVLLAHGIS